MKKSQSSTEFMVFIGIAIIILLSYFAIAHNYLNLTFKQKEIISGQDLAKEIKNEINLAARVENGYKRTFFLPQKIGDKIYQINIDEREVEITIEDINYVELIATNIANAPDLSPGDTIEITKSAGVVSITN
tara:strand:- start:5601 stop:5996 length:396 start_codon:yes stop_codon:yes gene_type:complete